jgi:cysteinyl-tRNA synthetase
MKIWNTVSRKKEVFKAREGRKVRLYTCGPTVYNFAHIGNFRTYVFEDLLRRTLKYFGWDVEQVMNITDVDDKTIKGAIEQGVSLEEYTEKYTQAFFEDLKALRVQKVEHYPRATNFLDQMIHLIQNLLDKELAYQGADKSIYFSIHKFPSYGKLSHLDLSELQTGASERVDNDEYDKENVGDFVLWKAHDIERDGPIYWESPFGPGRPGWHIECSAMAMDILGDCLDIHVGGVDNIFPHHENEIAQSEGCSGKCFAKYWMHSEHLIVDGKKMSKSLNNFYTLRNLLDKGFSGVEVRYMLLQTHYRTQLNFTLEGIKACRSSLERLQAFILRLKEHNSGEEYSVKDLLEETEKSFSEALADDLNISVALAAVFELVRKVNTLLDEGKLSSVNCQEIFTWLKQANEVLDIIDEEVKVVEIPQRFLEMLSQRQEARMNRDWALSDQLRDQILEAGYVIEDTPKGPRLKQKESK